VSPRWGVFHVPGHIPALLYVVVRLMLEALIVRGRSEARLRAEVLALHHQLGVLGRQVRRPCRQPTDRLVLSARRGLRGITREGAAGSQTPVMVISPLAIADDQPRPTVCTARALCDETALSEPAQAMTSERGANTKRRRPDRSGQRPLARRPLAMSSRH
jgi:hypothetical protein